jgi:hypothetical protein
MNIEVDILHVLKNVDNYSKYRKYVKNDYVSDECNTLIEAIGSYHKRYGKDITDWKDFYTWLVTVGGSWTERQRKFFGMVTDNLATYTSSDTADEIVMRFQCINFAETAIPMMEDMAKDGDPDKLHDIRDMLNVVYEDVATTGDEKFVTSSIKDILASHVTSGGYDWRFDEMNVMAGPIRPGDFVIVVGRPENGKTSFVSSETTYMATQFTSPTDKVVIFNNEEAGEKLLLRAYTCGLNMAASDIAKLPDPEAALRKALGGDRFLVYDDVNTSTYDVERVLSSVKPKIVVFNVLEKIRGFDKMDEVQRLKTLAVWARGLGKRFHCVVFAVWQADAGAEGERYIRKHQVYGSKTGAPSEADVIIGIGATFNPTEQDYRFFHLSKNKLSGGPKSDPRRKHGYAVAHFDTMTGLYTTPKPSGSAPKVEV